MPKLTMQKRLVRKLLVLNGPNLNLLGYREPDLYGEITLNELEGILLEEAERMETSLECKQSNSEGQLVDWIQQAEDEGVDYVIINPGAYTHTSIALRDAFLATDLPFIEVHVTNIFDREEFRHKSVGHCGRNDHGSGSYWICVCRAACRYLLCCD